MRRHSCRRLDEGGHQSTSQLRRSLVSFIIVMRTVPKDNSRVNWNWMSLSNDDQGYTLPASLREIFPFVALVDRADRCPGRLHLGSGNRRRWKARDMRNTYCPVRFIRNAVLSRRKRVETVFHTHVLAPLLKNIVLGRMCHNSWAVRVLRPSVGMLCFPVSTVEGEIHLRACVALSTRVKGSHRHNVQR